ncbi:hypothetical protein REH76_17705, partial [Photobacterium damselae]
AYKGFRVCENGVCVYFDANDKLETFSQLSEARDYVDFPFVYIDKNSRLERTSPETGWALTEERKENLSSGESHLREKTIQFLRTIQLPENPIIFDPACSTGVFLAEIKQAIPSVTTIGQDLSQSMVDEASQRVDVTFCGCSSKPKVANNSCDFEFIRLMNSEVVNRSFAEKNINNILNTVRVGGRVIIFGHTPVLLPWAMLADLDNFKLKSCLGKIEQVEGIYQYYILERTS